MKCFQAVIFDMDGVIVDSEPLHERAFRDVFHKLGYGETHGMDFPAYYGRSDRALWQDFVAKHQPAQTLDFLADWKQKRFIELVKQEEPIFSGLPGLLEKLATVCSLAVASGFDASGHRRGSGHEKPAPFFPVVVSVQDVAHPKPAPDVFLRAAQLLKVAPEQCWVIEDAAFGVEAALAAGMRVIGITNSLPAEKLSRATHVVKTYAEIERLLLAG